MRMVLAICAISFSCQQAVFGSAGGCVACTKSHYIAPQAVVQYPAVNVTFVPSQVSLGGGVTIYDPNVLTNSGLGYSYQGPVVNEPAVSLNEVDAKLDALIAALGASSTTVEQPVETAPPATGTEASTGEPTVGVASTTECVDCECADCKCANGECNKEGPTAASDVESQYKGWRATLEQSCFKCHGSDADNGFSLLTDDGSFKDKLPRYEIYRRLTLPEDDPEFMPKGGKRLDDASLELVRQWVHDGLDAVEY